MERLHILVAHEQLLGERPLDAVQERGAVFGGKWKSRIICVLAAKDTLRYSELRGEMANVSDAVLSASVKELMADGMVSRRSYDEIPPRVEYSLTAKGESAVSILQDICKWSGLFHREVTEDAPAHCRNCDFHGFGGGMMRGLLIEDE